MVIVAPGRRRYNRPSDPLRACRRPVTRVQRHNRSARRHLRHTPAEAEIQVAREVVRTMETRDTIAAIRTATIQNQRTSNAL